MAINDPNPGCQLFQPGHRVHWIQWRLSVRSGRWRPARLLGREGLQCQVEVDGQLEVWRFHDEDATTLAAWLVGQTGELSDFGMLRLAPGPTDAAPCLYPRRALFPLADA